MSDEFRFTIDKSRKEKFVFFSGPATKTSPPSPLELRGHIFFRGPATKRGRGKGRATKK